MVLNMFEFGTVCSNSVSVGVASVAVASVAASSATIDRSDLQVWNCWC